MNVKEKIRLETVSQSWSAYKRS